MTGRTVEVNLEIGDKRTFACAVAWPGWGRSGKDERSALDALVAYGPRYAEVLRGTRTAFRPPRDGRAVSVLERVPGNATTDFGAPDGVFASDQLAIERRDLTRLMTILEACWSAFDRSVEGAAGVTLRKGPRGGGRDLGKIVGHVVGAESGYVRSLAASSPKVGERDPAAAADAVRDAVREALSRAVAGDLPEAGPRGGALWTPRRFLCRAAWHVLDHAWEIEDRAEPEP
jgi:hypothetical protein